MKNTAQLAAVHGKLVSFIWSIADDVLRDVFLRGQYRDVILPMFVLRRLDALLEPTKNEVLQEIADNDGEIDEGALKDVTGLAYYNSSKWTLKRLQSEQSDKGEINHDNFVEYLNGYSENIKDVLQKFDLYGKARKMTDKGVLMKVIGKFTDQHINLTNRVVKDPDGIPLPALSNIGMGYVFEELLRKFNEENNEEAGEHFTPREVIDLMAHLVFDPLKDNMPKIVSVFDPAGGTGGMLTESYEYLTDPANGFNVPSNAIQMFLTETVDETYAVCKSDLIIKGLDPIGIKKANTITDNPHSGQHFGFMMTNPPYGKSWSEDQKQLYHDKALLDDRFALRLTNFKGEEEVLDCTPRTSDGQLLFMMELIDKMNPLTAQPQGARAASIHNGSALFTGDAGSGESNTRRYLIENDLVEAIVQLPNNIFYNTGIATYCWLLTNKKQKAREGKIQLIDASQCFVKLRKNLGDKNCELSPENISDIVRVYNDFTEKEADDASPLVSKIFEGDDFRYYRITVERPLRLRYTPHSPEEIEERFYSTDPEIKDVEKWMRQELGDITELSNEDAQRIRQHIAEEKIVLTNKQISDLCDRKKWEKRFYEFNLTKVICELFKDAEYDCFDDFYSKALELEPIVPGCPKPTAALIRKVCMSLCIKDPSAMPVKKRLHRKNSDSILEITNVYGIDEELLPDYGFYKAKDGYIEYESDSDLRDYENIPVKEDILDYFNREVRPYVDDAYINLPATKIGCEISFNKYFYRPTPLRSLEENTADILALDRENDGFIKQLLEGGAE